MCAAPSVNSKKRVLADKLREKLGIHYSDERLDELWKRFGNAFGEGFEEQLQGLIDNEWDQDVLERLIPIVSIGETYFFRDPKLWLYCKQEMFPSFIRDLQLRGGTINIWSAASSTGEEPYTISMLIRQFLSPELKANTVVFASDINQRFLSHAKKGKYSKWALRATAADARERFFSENADGSFQLSSEILESVHFFSHNLISDSRPSVSNFPALFNLIICRNVLMYFQDEQILKVIESLSSRLHEGGWLVLSPQDIWHAKKCHDLQIVSLPDLILLRKRSSSDPGQDSESVRMEVQSSSDSLPSFPNFNFMKPDSVEEPMSSPQPDLEKESQKVDESKRAQPSTIESVRDSVQRHVNAKDFDAALVYLEQAIHADSLNPFLYYFKSTVLDERGDTLSAVKALQQAIFLDPACVVAHLSLYHSLKRIGRSDQSELSLKNLLKLLEKQPANQLVPHSDGLTAGQILLMLKSASGGT